MPFAAALARSLQHRDSQILAEFKRGDSLEDVLNRHLMTVEELAGDDVFTTILLLSADGKRLTYGAAPTVPSSYCRASESFEVGPNSGSCGAAVYYGRPVYSPDIAKDAAWHGLRDLALKHGFRSCWSTPIRDPSDQIIGTFAILHRTVGLPTPEELNAIEMIIGHVAEAIMSFRAEQDLSKANASQTARPPLTLVSNNEEPHELPGRVLALAAKLEVKAASLDAYVEHSHNPAAAETLRKAAALCRRLAHELQGDTRDERPRKPFR